MGVRRLQALWWVLLVCSIVGVVWLAVKVLPAAFVKSEYVLGAAGDRGLKIYREKDGSRSIVYEPGRAYRHHIYKYIITNRGGTKRLICRINEGINSLDYDIAVKDKKHRVIKLLNVKEDIAKSGYTALIDLPAKTDYITIAVNCVNNQKVSGAGVKKAPKKAIAKYSLALSLLIMAEVIWVFVCFAFIYGDVFVRDYLLDGQNIFSNVAWGVVVAAVGVILLVIGLRINKDDGGDRR